MVFQSGLGAKALLAIAFAVLRIIDRHPLIEGRID